MSSTAYISSATLTEGHSDTINTLAFSSDGKHLASGGDDRVAIVWNTSDGSLLYRAKFDSEVDCLLWHPVYPHTVIVGCGNGSIHQLSDFSLMGFESHEVYLGVKGTVFCLDYAAVGCLALGMGREVHLTREFEKNKYSGDVKLPSPPQSDATSDTAIIQAVSLHFTDNGRSLIVSYMDHGITCWTVKNRSALWHINPPAMYPKIGFSALHPDSRSILVYNLKDGLHLYALGAFDIRKPRRHFKFQAAVQDHQVLHVSWLHQGRAVICGTTTGDVGIWEADSGEPFQFLPHADDIIQAISACRRGNSSYVATACVGKGQDTYIKIWKAKIIATSADGQATSLISVIRQSNFHELMSKALELILGFATILAIYLASKSIPWMTIGGFLWAVCAQVSASSVVIICEASQLIAKVVKAVLVMLVDGLRFGLLSFLGIPPDVQERLRMEL